jgi:hypothetical protein
MPPRCGKDEDPDPGQPFYNTACDANSRAQSGAARAKYASLKYKSEAANSVDIYIIALDTHSSPWFNQSTYILCGNWAQAHL